MALKAELRNEIGSGSASKLRRAGFVPGVIYGGEEPVAVSVNRREFEAVLKSEGLNKEIELDLNGSIKKVTIHAVDKAALADEFYSVDFKNA